MSKATYKDAGVNIDEGARAVELMKDKVKSTFNANVLTDIGGFGGLFKLDNSIENPVLVSGTDGVGTKLKIAFMTDQHDTVGQDLVAMCVNDILCQGAKPLFFLDYLATGTLDADKASEIVSGIADGCQQGQMALIGGETAEMPGFYSPGEYDLAGFAVGVVDQNKIIDGSSIKEGDVIIGLESSGIHSNGYSLARYILFDQNNISLDEQIAELGGTLKDILIEPTKIYTKAVMKALDTVAIKGMVHITGGGFYENIPRILPKHLTASIKTDTFDRPKIFDYLQALGNVSNEEMYKTFNMGIGYIFVIDQKDAKSLLEALDSVGEKAYTIGEVVKGESGVELW